MNTKREQEEYKAWLENCLKLTDLTKEERQNLETTLKAVTAKLEDN